MDARTPEQWFTGLNKWQQELVRWGGATVGMTVSRERELTQGVWRGFTSQGEIIAAVRPLWDEAWAQATEYRAGALKAGIPPEAAAEEAVMVRMFTTRVLNWMAERIRSARAAAQASGGGGA